MMQLDPLHQRQNHILVVLEHASRALGIEEKLQYLYDGTSRQFADGKEDGHLLLLPEDGQQRQDIQQSLGQRRVVLEEGVQEACVP